ncbi:MAG: ribonucleotide-diphosphate reductase subunit beta [Methanobacteriaceae archaeon]|nr:ribonucleotide-diphosphate reductase subunit beta [Methanobacteriaceae archaeon]
MLISTSRKLSQNTRKFCKNLMHATDSEYINRGKMSIRDVLLKTAESGHESTAFVYEIKGNPSKITFYTKAKEQLAILVSVNLSRTCLHINTKDLKVKCDVESLSEISTFLSREEDTDVKENYIHIRPYNDIDEEYFQEKEYIDQKIAIIDFYNKFGEKTDLKISVRKVINNKDKYFFLII